jgi:hypothetical protein
MGREISRSTSREIWWVFGVFKRRALSKISKLSFKDSLIFYYISILEVTWNSTKNPLSTTISRNTRTEIRVAGDSGKTLVTTQKGARLIA